MFKNVFWREPEPAPPEPKPAEPVKPEERKPEKPPEKAEEKDEEEYNPYEHRHVPKPTSDFGALAHILKTSLGTGILAMPMAFRHAGLVLGACGTIIIGIVCAHCVQMLVWNSHYLCKKIRVPSLNYPKTALVAFQNGPQKLKKYANCMWIVITIQLLSSFILGNSVYVVFISHTMYQVAEFYWKPDIDIRLYTVTLWIPLTLMCMLPNLKSLVPFSVMANFLVLFSFSITLYYIFREIQPTHSVHMVAPFETWPMFLCTVIFSVEGIGTVLSIENEMKHPEHFIGGRCGIAYIAMSVVVTLYSVVGFFGYLQYGKDTQGSVTLNLPIEELMAQTVKILIALAIFFTYALQFYVPIHLIIVMFRHKLHQKYHMYYNVGVRIGLVTLTMIISLTIPHLEPIISLVGATCFAMLGLMFPALIDTVTRYPWYGAFKWRLCKNIIIIVTALVTMVAGAYSSIMDIIGIYVNDEIPS